MQMVTLVDPVVFVYTCVHMTCISCVLYTGSTGTPHVHMKYSTCTEINKY